MLKDSRFKHEFAGRSLDNSEQGEVVEILLQMVNSQCQILHSTDHDEERLQVRSFSLSTYWLRPKSKHRLYSVFHRASYLRQHDELIIWMACLRHQDHNKNEQWLPHHSCKLYTRFHWSKQQ